MDVPWANYASPWTTLGGAAQPHASALGTELSNRPAITALVLGITSIVLIPAFALGLWASLGEVDTWVVILDYISLLGAICASLFGVEGRRLAKVGEPGRVPATIGWRSESASSSSRSLGNRRVDSHLDRRPQ